MSGITTSLWLVGSYIVVIGLGYALFNFVTKGFLTQYLKVKVSRGKKILVKCFDVTDTFYRAGVIDTKKRLKVKDRQKEVHTLANVDSSYVGRELGTNYIEVDITKDILIKKDFSGLMGYDSTIYDDMLNRSLMLPYHNLSDPKEIIKLIGIIISAIGVILILYLMLTTDGGASVVANNI